MGCHFCLQRGLLASCVGNLFFKSLRLAQVATVCATAKKRGELFIMCLSQHRVWLVVNHFHCFRVLFLCDKTFQRESLSSLISTNKMSFGPRKKLWECPQRCLGDSCTVMHVELVCPFIVWLWMRWDYAFLLGHKTKNKWKGKSPALGETVKGWENGGGDGVISKEAKLLFNFLMLLWDKIEFQCGCRLANGPLSEQAAYWQRVEKGMGRRDPLLREAGEKPVTPLLLMLHFQGLAGVWCLISSSGECGCVCTDQGGQEYVRFALPWSWTPVWPKKVYFQGMIFFVCLSFSCKAF